MRLKILILPFFLAMSLILSIGYIQPDFDKILDTKNDIATQEASLANMDSVLNNIRVLNSSLDTEQESEKFLLRYLPYSMDQDQVIDAFSFLAAQSGIIVTDMSLKTGATEAAAATPDGSASQNARLSDVKTFVLTGSVSGSYDSIKPFFDQLAHVGRFQKIQSFSLQKKSGQTEEGGSMTDLEGSFVAEYGYLPKKSVVSALGMPIFLKSELNFSEVADLKANITTIPAL